MTAVTPIDQQKVGRKYLTTMTVTWQDLAVAFDDPGFESLTASSSPGTFGRQRAPTVSMDTSAVTSSDMGNAVPPGSFSDDILTIQTQPSETSLFTQSQIRSSSVDLRNPDSFKSYNEKAFSLFNSIHKRPISPHDTSSSTQELGIGAKASLNLRFPARRRNPLGGDDEDRPTQNSRMENLQSESHMLDLSTLPVLDEHVSRSCFEKATFPPSERHSRSHAIQHNNITKQSQIREVPGYLGGHEVSAFPDSGSSYNLISKSLASEIGANINLSKRRSVPLPLGHTQTLGTVTLPFEFRNERQPYTLVFHVMKRCFQGCILGEKFLRKTETLGKHLARRVRQKLVSSSQRLRFNLVDNPHERLMGTLNGQFIGALADTGASINVMARSTAKHLGLKISRRKRHTTRLAFVDGSTASTTGKVFGVEWKFGSDSTRPGHLLDFHILDELPCDVVLGEDVLYENDAFSRHRDCFYNTASSEYGQETIDFLGLIINLGREGNSAFAITDEEILQELHRRGTVADEIAEKPISEQPAAQAAEDRRCEEWDRNRLIGTAGNTPVPSTGPQMAQPSVTSTDTGTTQTPESHIPSPWRRFKTFILPRSRSAGLPTSSSSATQLP